MYNNFVGKLSSERAVIRGMGPYLERHKSGNQGGQNLIIAIHFYYSLIAVI
jgi:hypothetical protein